MPATAEKARALRMQRLVETLDNRLDNPAAALEALMSELKAGELHPELWERMHAAAARDGKEKELASAYDKVTTERRMRELAPETCAELLLHAADFFQGVLGNGDHAEKLLQRLLGVVPNQEEAFVRLERRFEAAGDPLRLIELYSWVAISPPKPGDEIARKALNLIAQLPARTPVPDEACRWLVALTGESSSLLTTLETHCKKTERAPLACQLIEQALAQFKLPNPVVVDLKRRLVDLHLSHTGTPEQAMPLVEAMLEADAGDSFARAAAERLLGVREVASRAAAAVQLARRHGRSQRPDSD